MVRKIIIFILSCLMLVSVVGCTKGLRDKIEIEDNFDVDETVELTTCSLRDVSDRIDTKGEVFYIDATLKDSDGNVDYVYSANVNGTKYTYEEGAIETTAKNSSKKTVEFSIKVKHDGNSKTYEIDNVIIMSVSGMRYFVDIAYSCKPVDIPSIVGNGTEASPYMIYDAQSLLKINDYPKGTYFKQANDIDLSTVDVGDKLQGNEQTILDRWKPIGSIDKPFEGHYDGNNYKITKLSIQRFDYLFYDQGVGFFGHIINSEIKNVIFENHRVEVRYALAVGTLVGYAEDSIISGCDVIQGKKENFESGNWSLNTMGGLIGYASGCVVMDCNVKTDLGLYIQNTDNFPEDGVLGGIVGIFSEGILANCYFGGSMESGKVSGGIIGRSDQATVTYCESDAYVMSSYIAGGIVGQLWRSDLTFSEFSGKISYSTNQGLPGYNFGYFGGIVGDAGVSYDDYSELLDIEIESLIMACRFSGDITKDGAYSQYSTSYVGAICARTYDCFISDIEINSVSLSGNYVSALVAELIDSDYSVLSAIVNDVEGYNINFIGADYYSEIYARVDDSNSYYVIEIDDWDEVYDDLLFTFDSELWELDEGCPYLIQAGTIDGDIYDVFEELFPIM